MTTSKHICLIPAKASSKRLKKKNILKLNDKELIYYPIQAGLNSSIFGEEIYVSTESKEIQDIALSYGAKVPQLRKDELAHDPFGVQEVAVDFINLNEELKKSETLTLLLPTCPFISPKDIVNAHRLYQASKAKYLMSVVETDHNAQRSVLVNKNKLKPLFDKFITKKSQELDLTYRVNGAIIIVEIEDFLRTKTYWSYPIETYIMPRSRSIDIDTEFDFNIAQLIMQNRKLFEQ